MAKHISGGAVRGVKRKVRSLKLLVPTLLIGVALVGAACSSSSSPSTSQSTKPVTVHESMTILTGSMTKHPGWPRFSPANLTLPKDSTVVLTIYNYDDGTAPLSAGSLFDKVQGGTETVNGSTVTSIPNANISHTFTVPGLSLNIPIPPAPTPGANGRTPTVVTFTFKVTNAGTYTWQCEAPCGTGPTGMGGPMTTAGYMTGSLVVQ